MKARILYQAYGGGDPYIFLKFSQADEQMAAKVINCLIDKQFRVCYDGHDSFAVADADRRASRILSAELIIFLISADSLKSLEFRNCINYALSKKKEVFCVYLDEQELGYGFDMQLSNVPGVRLGSGQNVLELCEAMIKTDSFSQNMRGDDSKVTIQSNRRKTVAITVTASLFVVFLIAAAAITTHRIHYENSLEGQIERMTQTDLLDISKKDAATIELLKGKKIKTLVACDMGLKDIEALQYVECEELNLSQNPEINTLEPLLDNKNLKIVKVTQNMYPAIIRISGRHAFTIIVTG